jgi:hypothetical protein
MKEINEESCTNVDAIKPPDNPPGKQQNNNDKNILIFF